MCNGIYRVFKLPLVNFLIFINYLNGNVFKIKFNLILKKSAKRETINTLQIAIILKLSLLLFILSDTKTELKLVTSEYMAGLRVSNSMLPSIVLESIWAFLGTLATHGLEKVSECT